ncbi:MAG TPA: LeuA family protein [Polyangiaceae bacterium LLY-WYZ-15_(1-7)]|nr:2-isopropylmalate synthase [Myxococcales bacterium]HJK92908.1 LeuA family protein [Polyangiaceae bacterium LLY-WYZ-15_(1-7)]HJL06579.1 LeuA family protein [Polyangiaceae bacterium LLY-WYZ-15_(1-7)]HJL13793.1 LeuA family protein [Polyangiaceae bacterium LLY-WYZ-15_(1-7)]HJL21058.1 LeuA family protein [Polyangiaceae bacterium LLY-WYZ-15_(1-7)]
MSLDELVYDWNDVERKGPIFDQAFELHDETLRDGIQNPSVTDPGIGDKLEILHLLDEVGVESTDVGLPGAGPRAFEDVLTLCKEIAEHDLSIRATCAGRTLVGDIEPMVEVSQKSGVPVEVMTFIGSSPIRQYAEGWTRDKIIALSTKAIDFAVKEGLPVTFVTEDTTRSRPDFLTDLFRAAIDHGATRLCLCDTVGHSTPDGVRNLLRFTRHVIEGTGADVKIDWHGHNDRGLALVNSLVALENGADRVHGCVLGIGERVGNAPLDLLLINLKLLGALQDRDLSQLAALARKVSAATRFPIPISYPVVGEDAFRTATGVHAAAIIKAKKKGDEDLADRVYSGVPAAMFGREQEICIGPMSGISNVTYWLQAHGIEPSGPLIKAILLVAKASDHNLAEEEVRAVIERHRKQLAKEPKANGAPRPQAEKAAKASEAPAAPAAEPTADAE